MTSVNVCKALGARYAQPVIRSAVIFFFPHCGPNIPPLPAILGQAAQSSHKGRDWYCELLNSGSDAGVPLPKGGGGRRLCGHWRVKLRWKLGGQTQPPWPRAQARCSWMAVPAFWKAGGQVGIRAARTEQGHLLLGGSHTSSVGGEQAFLWRVPPGLDAETGGQGHLLPFMCFLTLSRHLTPHASVPPLLSLRTSFSALSETCTDGTITQHFAC